MVDTLPKVQELNNDQLEDSRKAEDITEGDAEAKTEMCATTNMDVVVRDSVQKLVEKSKISCRIIESLLRAGGLKASDVSATIQDYVAAIESSIKNAQSGSGICEKAILGTKNLSKTYAESPRKASDGAKEVISNFQNVQSQLEALRGQGTAVAHRERREKLANPENHAADLESFGETVRQYIAWWDAMRRNAESQVAGAIQNQMDLPWRQKKASLTT